MRKYFLLPVGFIIVFANSFGQCPGFPNSRGPTAATNVIVAGSTPWSTAQQIYVSDNVYSSVSFPVLTTHYLYVYQWGLAFAGTSTVCGIKIRIEKSEPAATGAVTDLTVRLYTGSAYSPNDYASATPWPAADTYVTYGSNSDLWGWGSISAATANNVLFGLRLRAQSTTTGVTASIDHIEMSAHSDEFLPVELLSFDAVKDIKNKSVLLKWKCASEMNNDYFTIERSRDNISWEEVRRIKGAGNSSVGTEYGITDEEPFPGESYYHLKQTDFDGTTKMLDVISIRFKNYLDDIMLYPSIATDAINIRAKTDINNSQIIISDAAGRTLKGISLNESAETFETSVNISDLSAGIYFVKITNDEFSAFKKFVKK